MSLSSRSNQAGFTLIELLVVIAIIGILSSVVLASLNTARNKGADAAIKSNLANARAQAESYYDSNTLSYLNACTSGATAAGVKGIYDFALSASNSAGIALANLNTTLGNAGAVGLKVTCHASATGYALESPLKTDATKMYCVDNLGFNGVQNTGQFLAGSDVQCN
ncbi:MAG: type II secretion system protein [Patescibacteria group bacterium]